MTARPFSRWRWLAILAGLAAGLVVAFVLVANRNTPLHGVSAKPAPVLRFIQAQALPFRYAARGYGVVRPAETWQVIANVTGRVVERHPALESGAILRAGTALLALDPSRYELAIAEAEAELASLAAELRQLDTEQRNTERLQTLEQERLVLAQKELARIERLAADGSVSRSQDDAQRRATLAQQQAVAALDNSLALMEPRRQRLAAQRARTATRLEQARQDLADTRFVAPYDLRLGQVAVEMHQQVGAGQRLFEADSLEAAEVEAHIPLPALRRLLRGAVPEQVPADALDIAERLDLSEIGAAVELVGADDVFWPARVSRIASGMEPGTRTARVVVRVDQPYRKADPPRRPPLQRDMYVQVALHANSPQPLLLVPAAAIHQGEVYLLDDTDRLQRQPVDVAFTQQDLAVIHAGLEDGARVIIDDPVPALGGMLVQPERDLALEAQLRVVAAGGTP